MIIKTPFAIALFTLGLTKTKYTDMLGYVLELWQRFTSPKTLDWMLDFFDKHRQFDVVAELRDSLQ